jgi:hypothetical protein
MIHKKVIDAIYKTCRNRPASPEELNIPLLFEKVPEESMLEIDGDDIVINSVDHSSPFRRIAVRNIHAIIEFEEVVAIVLHASIIFLSKENGTVHVHLKELKQTFFERICTAISV